ncbi:MAG: glutamate-5-semialdehyde dehydrogenase [Clostridia bacterium]|nr:glutamate-5-semialdehyde dehydrogenase [Clostridia bacterium]
MSDIYNSVKELCVKAKACAPALAATDGATRNALLISIAKALREAENEIIEANKEDLSHAAENGVPLPMIDRLTLNSERIEGIAASIESVAALPDPIGSGEVFTRPNGLVIRRVKVPLGVVAMIYEARPNVTADAAVLCLKSGNCVILRGGKEAIATNRAIVGIIRKALCDAGLPVDCVGLIDDVTREGTKALFEMKEYVDVLIPRGSKSLIQAVARDSRIPVIETGAGNCHLYVAPSADIETAVKVAVNAKMSRPSVCNAIETLLVHASAAEKFLPEFVKAAGERLEVRGDERASAILGCKAADESDWDTEYDDYIIAVRVVDSTDEAIAHINRYGTRHSEAIMTQSLAEAELFRISVDAAAVYVNASTRFTDGGEFGLGAEIGISTQKLHARGPMGLEALTCPKFYVDGNGQIR